MVDCDGECRPFPVLWAESLETQTGRQIGFSDFTGTQEGGSRSEGKGSATLLEKLRESEPMRDAARDADIVLIATGQNEANPGSPTFDALQAGNCGPEFQCVHQLGQMWSENFNAMLAEIDELRDGKPTGKARHGCGPHRLPATAH